MSIYNINLIQPRFERKGFTIIELLVAMGMASLVMASVVIIFTMSNQAGKLEEERSSNEQCVRAAMEVMAFELRMAGYIPPENLPGGDYPITTDIPGQVLTNGNLDKLEEATASTITFACDMNPDDDDSTVEYAEIVKYALSGTNLERTSWQWAPGLDEWQEMTPGTVVLAQDITDLAFVYTFKDGSTGIPNEVDTNPDNDTAKVRAVNVQITGHSQFLIDKKKKGLTLDTYIRMRNMGL
jgi:prepilin-type N-terminal cleavage/methylation domain-containing protein